VHAKITYQNLKQSPSWLVGGTVDASILALLTALSGLAASEATTRKWPSSVAVEWSEGGPGHSDDTAEVRVQSTSSIPFCSWYLRVYQIINALERQ
jgi:hypothetical protein